MCATVFEKKVGALEPGMILAETVSCSQSNTMLLKEGTILSATMIDTLRARDIDSVWIAEQYSLMIDPRETIAEELKRILLKRISTYAPEKPDANTSDKMVEVAKKAKKIALRIVEEPEIIKISMQMKLVDSKLLYHHGISTCALSLLVAGVMDFGDTNMEVVGTAALLHDLGCCEMAHLIGITQRKKHEEALWQEHPRYGYYLAKERSFREEICELILYHHEHWNGTGYPNQLMGEKIPIGASIINACGSYDGLIRQEKYKNYQAIEYIYGAGGVFFDSNVVNALCDNLAVYPLGSLVRLSTNEVGVVSNVRKNKGPRPVVRVFFNKVNKPYSKPKEVDLGKELTIFIKEIL
jgi:putative nucleotidyltransferase with HDIG domain